MSIPKFTKPMTFSNDYDGNVTEYGDPPKGYRFRKTGEKIDWKTDLWAASGTRWERIKTYWDSENGKVRADNWPVIAKDATQKTSTPLEQVKTLLSAHPEIALDVAKAAIGKIKA